MTGKEPVDVLLVGTGLDAHLRALAGQGLTHAVVPTSLEALVAVSRARHRVVILSAREVRGREREAVRALKEAGGGPEVLLTLPPDRPLTPAQVAAAGADDALDEPYFPEALATRARHLARRRREREAGLAAPALSPLLGSGVLADRIEDISDLSRAVPNLEQFVDLLLRVFQRRTGARRASLLLFDRKREELVAKKLVGLPEGVTVDTRVPLGKGISGRAAAEGAPLLVPDVRRAPFRSLVNRGDYRTTSCLSLPLRVGDTLLGVLNLADKESGAPFTEEDLYLLGSLAEQAAPELDNALRLRRVKALSVIDDLTGLYNRRYLRRALDREFKRAVRYKRALTVAILDVDHFKLYNDRNGHEAGNRALRRVGAILKGSFRNTDVVARYGGEEFAVILPETEKGASFVPEEEGAPFGAFRFLERVRSRIEEEPFENEEALPGGTLTISGGVASYPTDAGTAEALLEAADRSLYLAKAEGRNRVHPGPPARDR